jgi:hypothetical protein
MASNASLIVTPFRFRAVTSSPRGKWRSIFLTGGSVSIFLRELFSGSSIDIGDLLIRLNIMTHQSSFYQNVRKLSQGQGMARTSEAFQSKCTYQFSFCVSLAIFSSFPSFSILHVSSRLDEWKRAGLSGRSWRYT